MTAMAIETPFGFANATSFGRSPRMPMNEAQFEAFYRTHAGPVWSYIYRLTGNAATADDLLQKTFFRFLRANPDIANEDHLRRYIYRTATNLAMDHFRESKRQREFTETAVPQLPTAQTELRHDMMRVFGQLKPQERALLWLAHVEGSSHAEIAEALGLKEKSIKVMLFRARKRLGEMLSKQGLAPV